MVLLVKMRHMVVIDDEVIQMILVKIKQKLRLVIND